MMSPQTPFRIAGDQARAEDERAQAMLQNSGSQAVTPQMLSKFARAARQRIRLEGGGYRRDHLRALAQRVVVADGEVRIMGSKTRLLQALTGKNGNRGKSPGGGGSQDLKNVIQAADACAAA